MEPVIYWTDSRAQALICDVITGKKILTLKRKYRTYDLETRILYYIPMMTNLSYGDSIALIESCGIKNADSAFESIRQENANIAEMFSYLES
jgi:hypothetical protein